MFVNVSANADSPTLLSVGLTALPCLSNTYPSVSHFVPCRPAVGGMGGFVTLLLHLGDTHFAPHFRRMQFACRIAIVLQFLVILVRHVLFVIHDD